MTQALGPTNDISALGDSIFNDDNAHVWPTRFDLLILDALYDDAIYAGMAESEAARVAARALTRTGASFGERRRRFRVDQRSYDQAMEEAASADTLPARQRAATLAIRLADAIGPRDHRLGEAHMTAAFVASEAGDDEAAIRNLIAAETAHVRRLPPNSPHLARVRAELAVNMVQIDQFDVALRLLGQAAPVFAANGADWQLADAFRWRAIALSQIGEIDAANAAALEALAWARYVYGRDSRAAAAWAEEFKDLGVTPGE